MRNCPGLEIMDGVRLTQPSRKLRRWVLTDRNKGKNGRHWWTPARAFRASCHRYHVATLARPPPEEHDESSSSRYGDGLGPQSEE